jgi:hypothetical protein
LPLFLQKESGVWGEAPINKHPEKEKKAFCTICTDEPVQKVAGFGVEPRKRTFNRMIISDESFVIPLKEMVARSSGVLFL